MDACRSRSSDLDVLRSPLRPVPNEQGHALVAPVRLKASSTGNVHAKAQNYGRDSARWSLTESVEVLVRGGEGVILVKGADFGGALIGHGHRSHLPLLGGAVGRLLLLLCQLPVVVRSRTHTDKKQQGA